MATHHGAHTTHPSRQNLLPRDSTTNSRKRQKPSNLSGSKSFKKARPVNELKTSIRNLNRLLARAPDATTGKEALPPKIRIAKERELASAQHELAESVAAEARSKMIARYHKIRFFDRQKATKRLKRARKAMKDEEDVGKREAFAREADDCEVDVQYAMFYPLDVPYVALYPSVRKVEGKEEEEGVKAEVERQGDKEMRALLTKCAAEGKLDALRNGKLDKEGNYKAVEKVDDEDEKPSKSNKKKADGKEAKNGKRKAETIEPEESGDESDGGFFE